MTYFYAGYLGSYRRGGYNSACWETEPGYKILHVEYDQKIDAYSTDESATYEDVENWLKSHKEYGDHFDEGDVDYTFFDGDEIEYIKPEPAEED